MSTTSDNPRPINPLDPFASFIGQHGAVLKPEGVALIVYLNSIARDRIAEATYDDLAEVFGWGRASAVRHMQRLQRLGFVERAVVYVTQSTRWRLSDLSIILITTPESPSNPVIKTRRTREAVIKMSTTSEGASLNLSTAPSVDTRDSDSLSDHDRHEDHDRAIDAIDDEILSIYFELTGNPECSTDRETAREIAEAGVPIEHVRAGIERTIQNAARRGKKFGSLKYCIPEITSKPTRRAARQPVPAPEPTAAPDVAIDDVAAAKQRVWAQAAVILARNPRIARRDLRLELTLWCADNGVGLEVVDLCYPAEAERGAA
jgi:hypothetical protein